tara:strand:- start:4310 stop:4696 length:387 start_codon:yes stop_codon:yes gene_type:complete
MNDENKIRKRAEKIAEKWRRSLACHNLETAKAEITFELSLVQTAFIKGNRYYDLSPEEAKQLYHLLLSMKNKTLSPKRGSSKKLQSFKLSEDARFKLEELASRGGVSKTAVIEHLLMSASRFEIIVPE